MRRKEEEWRGSKIKKEAKRDEERSEGRMIKGREIRRRSKDPDMTFIGGPRERKEAGAWESRIKLVR